MTSVARMRWDSADVTITRPSVTAGGEWDESKVTRVPAGSPEGGEFGGGEGGGGPKEVLVPTRLADVSPALRAKITERYGDRTPPEDLTEAGWHNAAAWDAIMSPDAKALDDPKVANPDRYEPAHFGVRLKEGETEPHSSEMRDGGGPPRVFDITPRPKGMSIDDVPGGDFYTGGGTSNGVLGLYVVPGSDRPPDSVYRVMSTAEWDGAKTQGFIQSNESMNFGHEGTVTSLGSTGSFYVPPPMTGAGDYRIVRIAYTDADGWHHDKNDGYVKTDEKVPFSRVQAVTPVLANPRVKEVRASGAIGGLFATAAARATFDWDPEKHPRGQPGNAGQFGPGGGADTSDSRRLDLTTRSEFLNSKTAVKAALDKLPPGTAIEVSGFRNHQSKDVDDYVMAHAVAMRNEQGITMVKETAAGWDSHDVAMQAYANQAMTDVAAAHEGVIGAFGGNAAVAASVQDVYALASGRNPGDDFYAKQYGRADFRSLASADRHGGLTSWNATPPTLDIAVHEAGHQLDSRVGRKSDTNAWDRAVDTDIATSTRLLAGHGPSYTRDGDTTSHPVMLGQAGVTSYGSVHPHEDFAEGFRLLAAERRGETLGIVMSGDGTKPTFSDAFPARAKILDQAIQTVTRTHRLDGLLDEYKGHRQ